MRNSSLSCLPAVIFLIRKLIRAPEKPPFSTYPARRSSRQSTPNGQHNKPRAMKGRSLKAYLFAVKEFRLAPGSGSRSEWVVKMNSKGQVDRTEARRWIMNYGRC